METPTSTGTVTQPAPLKPWKQVAEESNIFSLPPEQRIAEYDKWSAENVAQGIRDGDFDSPDTFSQFKLFDIRTRKNLASDDIIGPSDDDIAAEYDSFAKSFQDTQRAFSANKPTPQDEAIQGEVLQGKRNAAFVRGQMVFNPAVVNDPQKYREAILESDAPADIKMFYAGLRPEMEKSATVTRRRELAGNIITRDVADKVVTAIQEGTELFGADIGTPQSPALKKNKDGVWSAVDPEYVDQSASMLDIANARYNPLGDSQYKPLPAINEYQKKYGLTDEQVQQDYMESLIENAPTTVNRWLGKATSIEDYVKQLDSTVRVKNKDVAPEVRVQDPNLFFDEQGYNAAVDKANAPDEAKNLAKAARTQFADAVAGDIYNNLLNNRDDFREDYAKDVVSRGDMEKAITRYYKDKKDQAWYDDVGETFGQAGTALSQGGMNLVMMPSAILGMFGSVKDAEDVRIATMVQNSEMQAEEAVANRTGGAGFIKLNNDVMRIIPDLAVQMGIAVLSGGALSGAQAASLSARTGISKAAARTAIRQAAITGEKAALKAELVKLIPDLAGSAVDDVAEEALKASARTMSNNPFKGGIGTQRAVGSAYAGLTSAASTFGQVYTDVVKMGKSPEEAIATARTAGVVAGAITSGLTHSFGMLGRGGVEDFASMGRKAGEFTIKDIVNAGLLDSLTTQEGRQLMRNIAKGISKDALSEGAEEGLDQALNLISQYATNPSPEAQNRKATDVINESLYGGLLGIIAGGGTASVGQARATAPGITAQQMQAEILGAQQPVAPDVAPLTPVAPVAPAAGGAKPPQVNQGLSQDIISGIQSGVASIDPDMRELFADVMERKLQKKGSLDWKDVPSDLNQQLDTASFASVKAGLSTSPMDVINLIRGVQNKAPVAPAPIVQPQQPITQPAAVPPITPEEQANYDAAKAVVIAEQSASISLLQRKLRLGYGRAQRIMDLLEQDGVIAPKTGTGAQSVLVQPQAPVVQPSANPAVQEAQATVESLAEIPDTTQTATALAALANAAVVPKPEFNLPEIEVPAEPAPEAQPEEEIVTPIVTPKEWAKSLPDAEEGTGTPNETSAPQTGSFKEGQITADKYGDDPYIYRDEWINVADYDPRVSEDFVGLEGLPYETVAKMETTQRYAEWYREGSFGPPITIVQNQVSGRWKSNNRRRIVAAIEAGVDRIPARVEIGRASEIMPSGKFANPAIPPTPEAEAPVNAEETPVEPAPAAAKVEPETTENMKTEEIDNGLAPAKLPKDATKIASSPTREGVEKQITKFYAGEKKNLVPVGNGVFAVESTSGKRLSTRVIQTPKGFYFVEGAAEQAEVKAEAPARDATKPEQMTPVSPQSEGGVLGYSMDAILQAQQGGSLNSKLAPVDHAKAASKIASDVAKFKIPVDQAVVKAYGITLPPGYVKQGELYVYQPEQKAEVKAKAEAVAEDSAPYDLQIMSATTAEWRTVETFASKQEAEKGLPKGIGWRIQPSEKPAKQPKPSKPDAVQKPSSDAGVLRQEGQEVGLPKVDQGGRSAEQEGAGQEGEVKTELTPEQQDVVVFIEQEDEVQEEKQKIKKRITPGKARKIGIAKQIERLGINSNDPDSVISALEKIANNPKPKPSEKHHIRIAKDLLSVLKGSGVQIQLVSGNDAKLSEGDSRVNGWFDPKTNTAYINLDGPHELGIEETILHELVHASGEKVIQNPQTEAQERILGDLEKQMLAARKNAIALGQAKMGVDVTDLNMLIDMAASQNDYGLFDILYGVSSLSEYHAHATTSRSFQKFLATYKEGGKRSLFERFVNSITRMLSGKKTAENSDAEKAYATLLDLMREGKGDVRKSNADTVQSRARGASTEQDAEYLELAKDPEKNAEALQAMVDAAAMAAGGKPVFRYVSRDGMGMLNSEAYNIDKLNDDDASDLEDWLNYGLQQPRDVSADQVFYFTEEGKSINKDGLRLLKKAARRGFVEETRFAFGNPSWETDDGQIAVSPNQIKSADPVTRDDAGNIIPLSQRFQPTSTDIRYSLARGTEQDSAFVELERRFKAGDKDAEDEARKLIEKIAKEQGWTEKAYHGTPGGGFTVFDIYGSRYGLMGQGAYFTNAKDVAQSYADNKGRKVDSNSQTPQVYEVFLKPGRVLDMEAPVDKQFWLNAFGDYLTEDSLSEAKTNEDAFRAMEGGLAYEGFSMSEGAEIVTDGLMSSFDSVTHIGGKRMGKGKNLHNVTIVFSSEQIKSADPFTYDDNGNLILLSERFQPESPDIRYSRARGISAKQDSEYLAAVEAGDMETAQQMVDEAAKEAGYEKRWNFSEKIGIDPNRGAFYTTSSKSAADSWGEGRTGETRAVFISSKSPAIEGKNILSSSFMSPELAGKLKAAGFDSASGGRDWKRGDEIAVFSPEQIKSADPVTRDGAGNVIPLSQRFQSESPDIRYSKARGIVSDTVTKYAPEFNVVDNKDGPSVFFDGRNVTVNPSKLEGLDEYEVKDLAERAVVAAKAAPKDPIAAGIIQQTDMYDPYNFDSVSRKEIRKSLAKAHAVATENGMAPLAMDLGVKLFEYGGATDAEVRKSMARGTVSDEEYLAAVEAGDMEAAQQMVDEAAKAAGGQLVFHGGDIEGDVIDVNRRERGAESERRAGTFYASSNPDTAKTYPGKQQRLFFFLQNPFRIGTPVMRPAGWTGETAVRAGDKVISKKTSLSIGEAVDRAKQFGYDGVIYDNIIDTGRLASPYKKQPIGSTYVAFNSNQIKSADPVTRDDAGNVIPLSQRFQSESPDIRYSKARGTELVTYIPRTYSAPRLLFNKLIAGFRSRGMVTEAAYEKFRDSEGFKKANASFISFIAKDYAKVANKYFGEGEESWLDFRVFSRDATGEVTVSKKGFKTPQEAESFAKVSGSKDYIVATGQDLMNKALGSNSHTLKEDVRDKIEKLTKKGLDDIANSIKAYKEEYLNYWNLVTLEMQSSFIDEKQIATLKEKKQQWMKALELRAAEQRKIVDDARKEAVRAALADGTNRIIAQQEFAKAYLPDDLVYQIGRAREKIDELSNRLREIKWLMDGSELEMIIGERLEVYVTRSYEAFETKDRVGYVNWLKEAYQALYEPGKAYDPLAMDRIMPLVRHIKETIVQRRIEDLVRENEQNQIDDIMAELIADPRQITQVDRIPGQPIEGTEYEQLVRAVAKKELETRRSQEKKDFIERAITSLGRTGFASNIGDARKRKVALRKEANRLYEQRYPEQEAVSDIMGAPNPLRWAMMTEAEAHDIANVERSLSESPGNINGSAIWTSSINGLKYSSFMAAVNDDFQKNLDFITGAPTSKTGLTGATANDWKRLGDKILEHKNDVPAFLRTFLGEKDNPLLRVSDTIMKQSHLVAVGELYQNLAKVGKDEGWLVEAQVKNSDAKYNDWKPILNSENTDQGYGSNPFKKMYADPVMIGAINTLLAANQPSNTATKVISRIVGLSLWAVTAGSVKAIVRNLSSLGAFLLNSGILSAVLVPSRTIPVLKNVVLAARIMNESMTAVGKVSGGKKIEGKAFQLADKFWTGTLAAIAAQRPATAVIKGASSFAQFASRMKENPSSEQAQEMYQLAVKLGVANDNVQKESIQRLLDIEETISRKPVDRNLGKFAKALKLDGIVGFGSYLLGTIKTAGQQRSQLYGAPDDFTKILAWLNEMDAQARIHSKDKAEYNKWRGKDGLFTDMPEEHVRRAANYTTDLIQSHSKVWAHITQFKKMGFGTFIAPFIAARAEFYRNMVNAYRIAFNEMRSDIPAEKANGWMRFASALMAHLAYGTMAGAVLKMVFRAFADDEEVVEDSQEIRDAIRRLGPEYAKNKSSASVLYKNGTFDWLDISFSNPFAFVWESINAGRRAASDADVDDFVAWNVARDVLGENLGNFVSPQIAVGAGATVISGFDPVRGIKIWDSQADSTAEKVKKATLYYLKQAGLPGDWKSAMNIYNAAKGVEENGRKYKVGTEVAGVFLGASVRTIKVTDMVRQKLSQAKDNLNARITPFYNAQLGDSNVYGPEDFVDAAEKYHKTGQDAIKRMQRVVSAGRVLLAPALDGEKMLRNVMNSDDVKMNATVERAIMSGKSIPSTLSPQTRQKVGALGKKHNDDRLPITEDTLKRLNQKP